MNRNRFKAIAMVCALVASAGLLRFSYLHGAEENYIPVRLPYPGVGLTVADSFHIASGGRFSVQVVAPATQTERSANYDYPRINTHLAVDVTGLDGFRAGHTVMWMHRGSWSSTLDTFSDDYLMVLPSPGDYDIALTSLGRDARFTERGAIVELMRIQAVGPELLYPIAQGTAYLCLLWVAMVAVASAWRR
jgi:hypothetical protein